MLRRSHPWHIDCLALSYFTEAKLIPYKVAPELLKQPLILMCIGLAIGLVSARALSPWMASLLFGVKPFDPLTYGIAGVVILAAALAASYVPARRAAFLNPIEALRVD